MGKVITTKIKGMGWKAKVALISFFTLLLTVGIYQGWQRYDAQAAIGGGTWTSVYAGTGFPAAAGYTYAASAGTERLLVVAVSSTLSAAGTQTCAVTWGDTTPKTLTQATGDGTTSRQIHTYLFYLTESDIAAETGSTLKVTLTGGTSQYTFVRAAVYTGVNQTAPVSMSSKWTSGTTASTTVGPLNPTLTIATGERAVEIVNLMRTGSATARTITVATPWTTLFGPTTGANGTTTATNCYVLGDTTAGSGITSSYTVNGGSTAFSSIAAMVIAPAPTTTTLTVSANTPVATGSRLDTDTGVLMQRVTVTGSGPLELNTLDLNDLGTATTIGAAEIWISPTAATSAVPTDAVLLGSATNWAGTSTQFSLTGGTPADRSLGGTQPATKYIYIVYDMSTGQDTKTVQSSITAVGVVSPNTGATGLNFSSNIITLARSGNLLGLIGNTPIATTAKNSDFAVVMQRFQVDCDVFADNALELDSITLEAQGTLPQPPSVDAVKIYISPTSSTTLPADAKVLGAIQEWDKTSTTIPFVDDFGATSVDRTIIAGTSKYIYVVYSMFYIDSYKPAPDGTSPLEHIQSKVTAVGVKSPDAGVSGLGLLSNDVSLTKGIWSKITTCGGCHDTANINDAVSRNVDPAKGQFPGSHYAHSNKAGFACERCHVRPTIYAHANGFINFSGDLKGGKYSRAPSGSVAVINQPWGGSYTFGTCSNVACHANGAGGTKNTGDTRSLATATTPAWGSPGSCWTCHGTSGTSGAPSYANGATTWGTPGKANSHAGATHAAQTCDVCHSSVKKYTNYSTYASHNDGLYSMQATMGYTYNVAGGTCSTAGGCHGSVAWGGSLSCLDCHKNTITRTKGRPGTTLAAVTLEFAQAYGHKKSGRTAVTAADCIVCHLEGVGDGTNKVSATYHKDGNIDLRDPDVEGETPIKNLADAAFTFQRFSTSFAAGSRSSAPAANNIAQVITVKFCLKCHDNNGAANTTARVSGGTPTMPWGGSTGYAAQTATALNGVPVANGLVDVASQFATGNSSVHPVLGPRTKDFPTPARMVAPYNGFTRVGTAGTTTQGVVLNCFDCHNNYPTLNYLGKTGLLTLRTNAAHGNPGVAASGGMMRGVFYSTNNTLCSACHSGYTVQGNHGAGSAMASNTGRTDEGFTTNCMNCHGSKTTAPTTAPARPISAADFHGSNNRYTGVLWPTINARPVAFIRGWSGNAYHRGRGLAGTSGYAVGSAACGGGTCPGGGSVGDSSSGSRTYTPGGTY